MSTLSRSRCFPLTLGLVALLLVGAGCGGGAADRSGDADELVLDNGLRVLLLPHPGSGLVASNVFVGAGSTREEDRTAGSSHFLEHVLFNGTTHRTQEELYADADRIGAYNNATTQLEYTHFMMVAPAERLESALDIQADMLFDSTLPPEKFEKERGIVLEEMSKNKDDPGYRRERALAELTYGPGSDFARPVLGTVESIRDLPRPNVVEYYRRQYVPSNMKLVLMGDFDRDRALDLVTGLFKLPPDTAGAPPRGEPRPGPDCVLGSPGLMATREVEAPQVEVRLVTELPAGTPADDAALALLAHIAGGTKSSRLERALDEEPKLTHEESSASLLYRQGARLLQLNVLLTDGADPVAAAERLLAVQQSLASIGEPELAAARLSLLSQEITQLEQLHNYALFQGDRLWHMTEDFSEDYLNAVGDIDSARLGEAAARLLGTPRRQIVAAGPGVDTGTRPLDELEPPEAVLAALRPEPGEPFVVPMADRPAPLSGDEAPAVFTLDNGLTVIHTASPATRVFALHLLVKDRSLREPQGMTGIADLLHRTLAAVAEKSDGAGPSRLASFGGELKVADNPWIPYDNYYTTPLYSFIRLECVDSYHEEALSLLADMLAAPLDDEEALDNARNEMMAALGRAGSRPSDKTGDRFDEIVYPDNPLSHPVMGTPETVARITLEDLRDFAPTYLSPDQLVLSVVGDLGRADARRLVEDAFGSLENRVGEGLFPTPVAPTEDSVREEIPGGGNQASIRMGRVAALDPGDRWALIVAARIASDRMQQDLRETRGLAYSLGIGVGFLDGRLIEAGSDLAVIEASMGTRPGNVAEAEEGMLAYFAGGDLNATPDEIETAVNKYLARMRMRRVTSMGQAFNLGVDLFLHGDIGYGAEEAKGMAAVTPEDVNRVANHYLGAGPMVTVIAE